MNKRFSLERFSADAENLMQTNAHFIVLLLQYNIEINIVFIISFTFRIRFILVKVAMDSEHNRSLNLEHPL